ncbi:hypothetical protein [Chryseobacterium sp. Marseille-Q3244]|uniref:hypothetical protein n=1 Tax=Chryseobacterium sp. Marseille-Q3244 TaxID=2758092 RepID=UPI0020254760|nr:hypothetical protein [Chryseobacterium sp. Marseille-Q3244]
MNKENLKEKIETCIVNLQRLATMNCWNKISPNCVFIVSDFNEFERPDFFTQRKVRNKINKSKTTLALDIAIDILNKEYHDLYDVTLYIFKAGQKETVIEIQYYRKSNFKTNYFAMVKDNPPMFHSKISKPYYVRSDNKFDVNWESGGLRHFFNHFIGQIKYRINTFILNV